MSIAGVLVTKEDIERKMQKVSTAIHLAFADFLALKDSLAQFGDSDLNAIFDSGDPSGAGDALRLQYLDWVTQMTGLNDNYNGAGTVSARIFEIGKRVRPQF